MKNNQILLLSNAYYPSIGGIENSLRHLAQEAIIAGDNVKIMVSDLGIPEDWPNKYHEIIDEVAVERYALTPFTSFPLKYLNLFFSNFYLYQKLKKEYQSYPNTVVIARFHFAALIASWVGFKNIRYLVPSIYKNQLAAEKNDSIRSKFYLMLRVKFHHYIQVKALKRCKNFIFSQSMLTQCKAILADKNESYVITKPGVDFKRFYPLELNKKTSLKDTLDLPLSVPIVLLVGRLVKAKGCDLLIKAISDIQTPCHLVIVGSGTEEMNLKALVIEQGISHLVSFIPATKKVENYYQAADVFAMASNYEPLGQTILEALASGLSIVAFKNNNTVNTATQELGIDEVVNYASDYTSDSLKMTIEKSLMPRTWSDIHIGVEIAKSKFTWKNLYRCLLLQKY